MALLDDILKKKSGVAPTSNEEKPTFAPSSLLQEIKAKKPQPPAPARATSKPTPTGKFEITPTPQPNQPLVASGSFGNTQSLSFSGQPAKKGILDKVAEKIKKPAMAVSDFLFRDKMYEAKQAYEAELRRQAEYQQSQIYREQRKTPDKFTLKPTPETKLDVKFDPIKIAEDSPDVGEVDVKGPLRDNLGSFTSGALGSIEGLVGAVEWAGVDSAKPVADKLKKWSEELMPEDPSFANQVVSGFGSAAVFFIPGLGAMRATQFLSSISPRMAVIFGNSVATALEAATEAGMVYRDLRAQGKTEKEASQKAGGDFVSNAILIYLTNKFGIFDDNVHSTLKHGLSSAISEGGQEGVQQILSNISTGKPILEGVAMSTAIGSIVGATLGTFTQINPKQAVDALNQPPVVVTPQEDDGGPDSGTPPPPEETKPGTIVLGGKDVPIIREYKGVDERTYIETKEYGTQPQDEIVAIAEAKQELDKAVQLYKTTAIDQPNSVALRDLMEMIKKPEIQKIVQEQVQKAIDDGIIKLNDDGTINLYRFGDPKSKRLISVTYNEKYNEKFPGVGEVTEFQVQPKDIQVFIGKDESEVLVKPDVFSKLKTELPPLNTEELITKATPSRMLEVGQEVVIKDKKGVIQNTTTIISKHEKGIIAKEKRGIPVLFTDEGFNFEPTTFKKEEKIIEELPPEIQAKAEIDWEENYAEQVGNLEARSTILAQLAKTQKTQGRTVSLADKADVDKELARLNDEFIEKWQKTAPLKKETVPPLDTKPRPAKKEVPTTEDRAKAREAAKNMIKGYVERGDSLKNLARSYLGVGGGDYSAGIGGYADGKNIGPNKIHVDKIGDKELNPPEIFSLKELFDEIKSEQLLAKQKEDIIEPNEPEPDNLGDRTQPGEVSEDVSVGEQGLERIGASRPTVDEGTGLQRGTSPVAVGNGYTPSVELNSQIEALVAERGDDPNDYTEDEKDMLRQYTGAGGLESKGAEGRGLLDEYYTPPDVVKLVWQMVGKQIDFNKSDLTIIEPTVGIGNFITNAPGQVQEMANIVGHEINSTSATIAKILYPQVDIQNEPFESIFMTKQGHRPAFFKNVLGSYDLAIGNPPYGEHRGFYKGLGEEPGIVKYEEYVMKRSLDLVKEGGVVAMVVPSGFLAGGSSEGKFKIATIGQLVDAYRLPNGVFGTTEIGTDIVIFKKSKTALAGDINISPIANDNYFKNNPEKVLGEITERRGRFGMERHIKGTIENVKEKLEQEKVAVQPKQPVTPKEKIVAKVAEKKETIRKKIKNTQVVHTSIKKGQTINVTPDIDLSAPELELWKQVSPTGELLPGWKDKITGSPVALVNFYKGQWYNNFNYLQGNIYEKLDQLELDKDNISSEQHKKQKEALQAILPVPMTMEKIILSPQDDLIREIKLKDGSVLKQVFSGFLSDLPHDAFTGSSRWEVQAYMDKESVRGSDKERNILVATRRREVGNMLFNRFMKEKLEDEDKNIIAEAYNRKRNATHQPNYNNVPIQAPIHATFKGDKLALRDIQRAGAGFLVNKGVGGLAHEVGGGKTLTSIIAINEMVHKGWVKKPLFVVEKNNYTKWLKEIEEIVPGVVINKLANLGSKFKGDLTTLNVPEGSFSVMTVEGFQRIGFTEQTYTDLTSELKDVISDVNTEPKTKRWNAKFDQQIDEKRGKAMQKISGDRNFEDLGFDAVVLDEAHIYKNLFTSAKTKEGEGNEYKNVRGGSSSTRAIKAFFATQYILKKNNGRGVIMLTATPFTNSPIEFYSMLSFMARSRLNELGLNNVNDFMTAFMDLSTTFKVKANQEIQSSDVIERFRNAQQLRKLIFEFFDFKTGEELGVVRPERIRKQFFVNPTQRQIDLFIDAEKLLQETNAPVLQYINELMNITISPYLSKFETREPASAEKFVEESPKIKLLMEMIAQLKKDNPEGGRIIHAPRGIKFHELLKEYLVKNVGYKQSEVKILSGAVKRTEEQVDDIRNGFNAGEVKIIIGGDTIQRGIDLQENTTHMFRLTLPYRPDEITQIEGRAWRHGNQWKNFMSGLIMMNNSIDPFLNQTLETKDRRIKEAQKRDENSNVQEIGGDVNFEELKMQTITDPVKKLKAERTFAISKEEKILNSAKADLGFISQKFEKYTEAVDDVQSRKDSLKQDEERLARGIANQESPDSLERYKGWIEDDIESLRKAEARVIEIKDVLSRAGDFDTVKANMDQKQAEITAKETEIESLKERYEQQIKDMAGAPVIIDREKVNDYAATVADLAEINKSFFIKVEKIEDMPLADKKRAPSGMASVGSKAIGTFERLFTKDKPTENSFKLAHKSLEIIRKYAERVGEDYTPRRAVGVLFPKTGNIRVDALNDLSTVAHETVHYLDVKSGIINNLIAETGHGERIRRIMTNLYEEYYPTAKRTHKLQKRMEEGLATLIQKYIEQPSIISNKYPLLVKDILMPGGRFYNPIFTEFIKDVRGIVGDYQGLNALDKINTRITDGKTPINKTKFLNPFETIRTVIADALFPIEKVAKKAGVWMTNNDPSLWMREYNQYSAIFTNNVIGKRGYWSFRKGDLVKLHDFNWGTLEKKLKENNTATDFNAYLIARDQFFNYQALDELSEQIKNITPPDGPIFDLELVERIKDLTEERDSLKAVLDRNSFTLDEVVTAYNENKDRFTEEEDIFDKLTRADLDLEHDIEVMLVNDEDYGTYVAKKGYASMKREIVDDFIGEGEAVIAPTPGRTQISSLIRRRGSQKSILSPVESGVRNHQEALKKSLKQIVYNKIVKNVAPSMPDMFQTLPLEAVPDTFGRISFPQEKDLSIIMGRINYKRVPVLTDNYIKSVIDDVFTYQSINMFEQAALINARLFTKSTTAGYILFAPVNVLLDTPSALINTKNNYVPLFDSVKVLGKALLQKDSVEHQYYMEYIVSGGMQQTLAGSHDMTQEELRDAITKEAKGLAKVAELVGTGVDILSIPSQASEIHTRAIEYIKARLNGKSFIVAKEEAGRITAPFHHFGTWKLKANNHSAKSYIKTIAFFNAGIQVLDQLSRTAQESPEGRKRIAFVMMAVTAAVLASLATVMGGGDDDDKNAYLDLEPEELAGYIWFPNPLGKGLIKIRVSETLSGLPYMINMMILNAFYDGKYKVGDFVDVATAGVPDQFNPTDFIPWVLSWFPTQMKTVAELIFEKKTFPNVYPMISQRLQNLPPELQFHDYTANYAKYLGNLLGWSPIKIEHFITGFAGRGVKQIIAPGTIPNPFLKDYRFQSGRRLEAYYDIKEQTEADRSAMNKRLKEYSPKERQLINKRYALINQVEKLMDQYDKAKEDSIQAKILRTQILDKIEKITVQ